MGEYELTASWNDYKADWIYELQHIFPDGSHDLWTGDYDWARRQSEHYQIKMPNLKHTVQL